jgi:hypothetical protein
MGFCVEDGLMTLDESFLFYSDELDGRFEWDDYDWMVESFYFKLLISSFFSSSTF